MRRSGGAALGMQNRSRLRLNQVARGDQTLSPLCDAAKRRIAKGETLRGWIAAAGSSPGYLEIAGLHAGGQRRHWLRAHAC